MKVFSSIAAFVLLLAGVFGEPEVAVGPGGDAPGHAVSRGQRKLGHLAPAALATRGPGPRPAAPAHGASHCRGSRAVPRCRNAAPAGRASVGLRCHRQGLRTTEQREQSPKTDDPAPSQAPVGARIHMASSVERPSTGCQGRASDRSLSSPIVHRATASTFMIILGPSGDTLDT